MKTPQNEEDRDIYTHKNEDKGVGSQKVLYSNYFTTAHSQQAAKG